MVSTTAGAGRRFRIHRPAAHAVRISGCFTGWDEGAIDLQPVGDGWWEVELDLDPGDYEFQYVVDGHSRLADYAASGVKLNGFGQWVSLLIVTAGKPVETVEQASPVVIARIGQTRARAA